MDFLDPVKLKRHRLFLWLGYGLITIGIGIGSVVLLWQSYGYSVQNGKVIQDGMIFISSQPNPASIYINGALNSSQTNTRLTIPSGVYTFKLTASGYRPWTHVIPVMGGDVIHYDYPFLFPVKLTDKKIAAYSAAPTFASQSPSQQYLVVGSPDSFSTFYMYDLTNPAAAPTTLTLPAGLITPAAGQSWHAVAWADDNQHLLLEDSYSGGADFVEINTQDMTQSINLNRNFNVTPTSVSLINLKYNQFYFFDAAKQTLASASIANPAVTPVATGVVAFKGFQSNTVLYATLSGAPAGDVAIELENGGNTYLMKDMPQAATYLLDMAGYNGDDYAVVGDSSDKFVYIYKDPLSNLTPGAKIQPFRAITINQPTYEQFAPTAQFILVESGTTFAVYDIYNDVIYHYTSSTALDAPQQHAQWMDGDRLVYVSGGNVSVSDYDNTNQQTLNPALPQYQIFFAPDYKSYFSLSSTSPGVELKQTSLVAS